MTEAYEVPEPILNSPFEEPRWHWYIREGEQPEKRPGRRAALVYPPREERRERQVPWTIDGTLRPSAENAPGFEMVLVNLVRERVKAWRKQGYPA
jgi:type III restriction enzyme